MNDVPAPLKELWRSIRCPVCHGESIDESNVEIAVAMRGFVQQEYASGLTIPQIREKMVEIYGDTILFTPTVTPDWLYILPIILCVVGMLMVLLRKSS